MHIVTVDFQLGTSSMIGLVTGEDEVMRLKLRLVMSKKSIDIFATSMSFDQGSKHDSTTRTKTS